MSVSQLREQYPWEQPAVREDVTKIFNVRLSEPYLLKLKYIAERTPDSMQQFCLKVLLPAIDAAVGRGPVAGGAAWNSFPVLMFSQEKPYWMIWN